MGSNDLWDYYSKIQFPSKEPMKREKANGYSSTQIRQVVSGVKATMEKFNLVRSKVYTNIFAKLAEAEKKIQQVTVRMVWVTQADERKRRTIEAQRRTIADLKKQLAEVDQVLDQFCCCVCTDDIKDTAFNCGHVFCRKCAQQCANSLEKAGGVCPFCREKITSMMQLKYGM